MSWKNVWDVLTKTSILEEVLKDTEEMLKKSKAMFEDGYLALVTDDDKLAAEVKERDTLIDNIELNNRKRILEYLVTSSAKATGFAIQIITMNENIERVADYGESIARLGLDFPGTLDDKSYIQLLDEMKVKISEDFDKTTDSILNDDNKKAQEVIDDYQYVRERTLKIVDMLNKEKKMLPRKAIVYSRLSFYFVRISAHLGNVAACQLRDYALGGIDPHTLRNKGV